MSGLKIKIRFKREKAIIQLCLFPHPLSHTTHKPAHQNLPVSRIDLAPDGGFFGGGICGELI